MSGGRFGRGNKAEEPGAWRGVNEAEPVDVNAVEVRFIGTCKSTRVRLRHSVHVR